MLKIIRLSDVVSSVNGGDEIWLLADKLNGNFLMAIYMYSLCED